MADSIEKQYNQYLGKWVRVSFGSVSVGVLKKADYDWIELVPVLIDESIGNKKKDIQYRLENEVPVTVKSGLVGKIEPISEKSIQKLLKKYPFKEK